MKTKDTNQKILLNKQYLRSSIRFSLATDRTLAVGRGSFTDLELAFAGNFIDYYPCSFANFSS